MISILQNEVERRRPLHDELTEQMAELMARGGQIEVGPPSGYKPKEITYSNQIPPAPKPLVRRRVEAAPLPPPPLNPRTEDRMRNIERAIALASTHTQSEALAVLGISRRTLYSMAQEHGIKFKKPARGGANGAERSEQLEAREAKYAERIRAFLELGITRRQCCGRLAISNKAFERIIGAHGIDYPKARQGTSCAA